MDDSTLKTTISLNDDNDGFVRLEDISSQKLKQNYNIIISVDCSYSMKDNITKLRRTLINIINYFSNIKTHNFQILITLLTFDNNVEEVFAFIDIDNFKLKNKNTNKTIVEEILLNINKKVCEKGTTDLGKIIKRIKKYIINDYTFSNINIFMTDGTPTTGILNKSKLTLLMKNDINVNCENYLIGVGLEHDNELLKNMTIENSNTYYYFIDTFQNAEIIYGEILEKELFKKHTEIILSSKNNTFEFYDDKQNKWVKELYCNPMSPNDIFYYAVRNYNISCDDDNILYLTYTYKKETTSLINIDNVTLIEEYNTKSNKSNDYLNSINAIHLRVIVIQFMYIYEKNKKLEDLGFIPDYKIDKIINDMRNSYDTLKTIIEKINNIDTKDTKIAIPIIKQLLDDMYIHIEMQISIYCNMFTYIRLISQVGQYSYNVNNIDDVIYKTNEMDAILKLKKRDKCIDLSDSPVSNLSSVSNENNEYYTPLSTLYSPYSSKLRRKNIEKILKK